MSRHSETIHYLRDKLLEFERKGIGTEEEYDANKKKLYELMNDDSDEDHIYLVDELTDDQISKLNKYRLVHIGINEDYDMHMIRGDLSNIARFSKNILGEEKLNKINLFEPDELGLED